MGWFSMKFNNKATSCRIMNSWRSLAHLAFLKRSYMSPKEPVYIINSSTFDHAQSPFTSLLCRLKEYFQDSLANKTSLFNPLSGGQDHGHMPIMATGMALDFLSINDMSK